MARIAIGGFQHETNTFAPSLATLGEFETGDEWPELTTGPGLPDRVRGMNLPIAGFIDEAERSGHRLLPTTWGSASPSSYVTRHAYEHIAGLILAGLEAARPSNAVYLCLHGAMVTEHLEDGEGELLGRVRSLVGAGVPVVASLDFHSNTTPEMVEHANALVGYRTYPHIDMADTGRRAARHLDGLLNGSGAVHKAFRQVPFLIPLNWQCTTSEPMRSIMEMRDALEGAGVASLTVAAGFPAADIHHCGPSLLGYGRSRDAVERAVSGIAGEIERRESEFEGVLHSPGDGVRRAIEIARTASRPVVIADTQDNPGAGGDSDTTGIAAGARGPRRPAGGARDHGRPRGRARRAPGGGGVRDQHRARGQVRHSGGCPLRGGVQGRAGRRRAVRGHGADVRRRAHDPRADGVAADPRHPGARGEPQGPARRPGDVPALRHRAHHPEDHREQELGALQGRLRAHRLRGPDLRGPGPDGGGPGRAALDPAPVRGAHPPERPPRSAPPEPRARRPPSHERYRGRVHVEGEGPPLYMVHGIGSRRATWDGLVPALARDFTCVRYDLRGHGESPRPPRRMRSTIWWRIWRRCGRRSATRRFTSSDIRWGA